MRGFFSLIQLLTLGIAVTQVSALPLDANSSSSTSCTTTLTATSSLPGADPAPTSSSSLPGVVASSTYANPDTTSAAGAIAGAPTTSPTAGETGTPTSSSAASTGIVSLAVEPLTGDDADDDTTSAASSETYPAAPPTGGYPTSSTVSTTTSAAGAIVTGGPAVPGVPAGGAGCTLGTYDCDAGGKGMRVCDYSGWKLLGCANGTRCEIIYEGRVACVADNTPGVAPTLTTSAVADATSSAPAAPPTGGYSTSQAAPLPGGYSTSSAAPPAGYSTSPAVPPAGAYPTSSAAPPGGAYTTSSAAGAVGTGTTSAAGAQGTDAPAPGGSTGGLTECQSELLMKAISVFENGTPKLTWDSCADINDGNGYSCGAIQFTTQANGKGSANDVVELYKTKPDYKHEFDGISSTAPNFCEKWKAAASQKGFRESQFEHAKKAYQEPAMAKAKSCGITAPLAIGQVWDTTIQLGPEAADELIKKADAKLAAEGKSNTDQVAWLEAYMDARDEKVKGMPAPYPITVYRQTAFRHMLKVSKIDFTNTLETLQNSSDVPIKITCDGLSV